MSKEYSEGDLKAVWRELVRAFGERGEGCGAREIAAATGLSEEAATGYLEYLRMDGKAVREGNFYAPDPRCVRGVAVKYAMKKVDAYLRRKGRATVRQIVREIGDEQRGKIKREWVEEALRYLAGAGRVRYDKMTREWVTTVRGV